MLPEPLDTPLDLLPLLQTPAAAHFATAAVQQSEAPSMQLLDGAAGQQDDITDAAQLQQMVQQLQQQLQEARQVAQQWQHLHGELHQFCTESVLAKGGES